MRLNEEAFDPGTWGRASVQRSPAAPERSASSEERSGAPGRARGGFPGICYPIQPVLTRGASGFRHPPASEEGDRRARGAAGPGFERTS